MFLSKINSISFPFIKIFILLDGIFVTLEGVTWKVFLALKIWKYGYLNLHKHTGNVVVLSLFVVGRTPGRYLMELFKPGKLRWRLFLSPPTLSFPLHLGALAGKYLWEHGRTENQCGISEVWEREVMAEAAPCWTAVKQKQKPDNIDRQKRNEWGAAPARSCSEEGEQGESDAEFSTHECAIVAFCHLDMR